MDIAGHAAIVTGGGSGLGEATARMLAQAGAKVAVLDVNAKAAAEVAIDINGTAIACVQMSGISNQVSEVGRSEIGGHLLSPKPGPQHPIPDTRCPMPDS
jgi:NAD(P)-dependent dehydrogenase (short-subunit alcohol dehydrogenase family)